jgi:hypothetical protein
VYVMIVTEELAEWEDSMNIGQDIFIFIVNITQLISSFRIGFLKLQVGSGNGSVLKKLSRS